MTAGATGQYWPGFKGARTVNTRQKTQVLT